VEPDKENDMAQTPVYLSDDDRAQWQADVDSCDACAAAEGDEVCSDHDLDNEAVAETYSGSGG
jgi:hypothetical protein